MSEPLYMSREGVAKLEKDLKKLKYTERPTIVAEIKRTMELGDLSENAEYHAAKEAQTHIERKIADIEFKLAQVQIINADDIPSDKVYLFAKVLVEDVDDGEQIEYTISPPDETDVDNDIISVKSPIAAAMLGKGVGETVEVKVPAGSYKLKILKISRD